MAGIFLKGEQEGRVGKHCCYLIIRSGSAFTVNLNSDSLANRMTLSVSNVSRVHLGFGFIVNPDPDPIIE